MQVGLMFLFSEFSKLSQDRVFREVLEEISYAEELGFDSVWLPEHHFATPGLLGNPIPLVAAVSQRTRRIQLGIAAIVLPFQHPLRIAEDTALLDVLSEGRLRIGAGRGWQVPEFQTFQVPQHTSREMFLEALEVMKKAWTEDNFSHHGQFWQFDDVTVFPKPVQKPHPPVYWTVVTPGSYELAGRMGYPIIRSLNFVSLSTVEAGTQLYADQLSLVGKTLNDVDMPLTVKVYVAPTDEEAQRDCQANVEWFYRRLSQFLPGAPGRPKPEAGYEQYPDRPQDVAAAAADNLWEWGACFGSPETVLNSMRAYSRRTFTNHWMAWMRIGELEHKKVMRSMELFAKHVLPELKREAAPVAVSAGGRGE
ncbi:MAG: LLM class flavin-dependent oxidoreductase [Chloroflexi bacterium]|nr:LLM class flavin-dependent oxidoreductase [Chloroflexota bacterium]